MNKIRNLYSYLPTRASFISARQAFLAVRSITSKTTRYTQGENTFLDAILIGLIANRREQVAQAPI
ncbi:hypothetical protein [Chlorogloeopsis sp. ULAP01]|uniref:hypothetical protein n=1 Tax=Chlorogloeopsis sp. ULAP01 TaxID=3056483 RepID=UPI0025AD09F7|nr:hypothetical protein [Chlorogloeopsis sp. ULAP01]